VHDPVQRGILIVSGGLLQIESISNPPSDLSARSRRSRMRCNQFAVSPEIA
jgi:hypothetical protein